MILGVLVMLLAATPADDRPLDIPAAVAQPEPAATAPTPPPEGPVPAPQPPAPNPLRLEAPGKAPEAAASDLLFPLTLGAEPRPLRGGRLVTAEVGAALGNELGLTGAILGTTLLVFAGIGAGYSENCHASCLPEPAFRWGVFLTAVLAPPVLALATTHSLLKLAHSDTAYVYSWRATFLTGLVVNGLVGMLAAGFFQEVLVGQGTLPGLATAGVGVVVSAAAQVLVLNLTKTPAHVTPLVLPGGGGLAVGTAF